MSMFDKFFCHYSVGNFNTRFGKTTMGADILFKPRMSDSYSIIGTGETKRNET